jgi:hypothetical protein
MAAKETIERIPVDTHLYVSALSKPRTVRFKPVARFITIAFAISWIFIVYFGYQMVRDEIVVSGLLATLRDLGPLLLFALIWSVIGITTIRSARRDRKLLAEGEIAIAIVTHQALGGERHQQSKIRYEFKDATGRLVKGGGTDESWKLYENMEVPVFYDPENPEKNVTLCAATCELRTD